MRRLRPLLGVVLVLAVPGQSNGQAASDSSQNLNALTLEQLMQLRVESAALHPQTLQEAPASVTVITAEEIQKYGYRTLGEALASARGFYVDNSRAYDTVGVRGFNFPGDYSSHVLVLVNGHNMADNIFDYMLYFGNDFPIDMNLIKQIEIVRGPSSALYGSNAMFATINIITKPPGEAVPLTLTAEAGSFGEKKGQITATSAWGSAKVLVSGSVFNTTGESPLFFPAYDAPQTNYGNAIAMNGERGYHFFLSTDWRHWTITAVFGGHDQITPISWGNTIFNDRGTQNYDHRDFVEALYVRQVSGGTLRWRTYYDSMHYLGRFEYSLADGAVEDNRTNMLGNWVGSQLTYQLRPAAVGVLTVSAEARVDLRNRMQDYDVSPAAVTYLNSSNRDGAFSLVVQDEKRLSEHWRLDLGIRVDDSHLRPDFVSPRGALIFQGAAWTYKLLYGRSYRNPSAFQLFYDDGVSGASNPTARPEWADTLEVDVERKLGKRLNLQASAYGYRLRGALVGVYLPNGLLQYQNSGRILARGVELEINGRPASWLEASASYALQTANDDTGALENSPHHLAKLRFAASPFRKLDLSTGMQYESSRLTLTERPVRPVYVADFTLTTKHLLPNLDLRFGLRNAFNKTYYDPTALYPVIDSMPQPGRSFFVNLIARSAR